MCFAGAGAALWAMGPVTGARKACGLALDGLQIVIWGTAVPGCRNAGMGGCMTKMGCSPLSRRCAMRAARERLRVTLTEDSSAVSACEERGMLRSSSTDGSMLCELENLERRGVSPSGVHCDSPCSLIVSRRVVMLSSLSPDSYASNG